MEQREILIKSTLDGTLQPSLYYRASGEKRPILVSLHTWSFDRFNQVRMAPYAEKYGFNLLLPDFRGANTAGNPNCTQACGSALAKQDIKDAIDYAVKEEGADPENIFLLGQSGGGHMALLMAGYCPELFRAIGAFVPITDLKKWSEENVGYGTHVRACCGSEEEMLLRSPIHYIDEIARANVKIFHGKFDPVVPVTQSMELYERIFAKYPRARVFLDLFDGGHDMDMTLAFHWFLTQYEGKQNLSVTG